MPPLSDSPLFTFSGKLNPMRAVTTFLCLTLVVLLFNPTRAQSADFQKGLDAYIKGDYATALGEWKPLAEQGVPTAQYNLGAMYREGEGVSQNYNTAVKWYKLAAEQGDISAQYSLGRLYQKGEGVPRDYESAVKWYTLAAEQRLGIAQHNLGWLYGNGLGTAQDYVRAYMWYEIAETHGVRTASRNLNKIAKSMTSAEISAAQSLASECVIKNYKGC